MKLQEVWCWFGPEVGWIHFTEESFPNLDSATCGAWVYLAGVFGEARWWYYDYSAGTWFEETIESLSAPKPKPVAIRHPGYDFAVLRSRTDSSSDTNAVERMAESWDCPFQNEFTSPDLVGWLER